MKRLLLIGLALLSLSVFSFALASDHTVLAAAKDEVCKGIAASASGGVCDDGSRTTINEVLKTVVNILSAVSGVIAVIMLVVAGFKYITSEGDSGKINSAKQTLTYALVGIVIVALSQSLVRFVLNKVVHQ